MTGAGAGAAMAGAHSFVRDRSTFGRPVDEGGGGEGAGIALGRDRPLPEKAGIALGRPSGGIASGAAASRIRGDRTVGWSAKGSGLASRRKAGGRKEGGTEVAARVGDGKPDGKWMKV